MQTTDLHAGDSNVLIPIDSLAGTPGFIENLTGATCSLVVLSLGRGPSGSQSRQVVPPERFVPNNDGRTFIYTKLAADTPFGGVYNFQIVATFTNGQVRTSTIGAMTFLADL